MKRDSQWRLMSDAILNFTKLRLLFSFVLKQCLFNSNVALHLQVSNFIWNKTLCYRDDHLKNNEKEIVQNGNETKRNEMKKQKPFGKYKFLFSMLTSAG